MRVPSCGQALDERRIVREGMRLAEAMLVGYVDPPSFTLPGMIRWIGMTWHRLLGAVQHVAAR